METEESRQKCARIPPLGRVVLLLFFISLPGLGRFAASDRAKSTPLGKSTAELIGALKKETRKLNPGKTNVAVDRGMRAAGVLGRGFLVLNVVESGNRVIQSETPGAQAAEEVTVLGAAVAGGEAGAALGAVIGGEGGPILAAGGALLGGIVGSVAGGLAASGLFEILDRVEPPTCPGGSCPQQQAEMRRTFPLGEGFPIN